MAIWDIAYTHIITYIINNVKSSFKLKFTGFHTWYNFNGMLLNTQVQINVGLFLFQKKKSLIYKIISYYKYCSISWLFGQGTWCFFLFFNSKLLFYFNIISIKNKIVWPIFMRNCAGFNDPFTFKCLYIYLCVRSVMLWDRLGQVY